MGIRGRFVLAARFFMLAVLFCALVFCLILFWPRFLYQEGITQLKLENYDQAIHYFDRAEKRLPNVLARTLAQADQFRLCTYYGQAFYHKGIQNWKENGSSVSTIRILQKGKAYLIKAQIVSRLDYRNTFWLAHTEHGLERLHAGLYPLKPNPYNAHIYYLRAMALRPAGSGIRYSYIKYLNESRKLSRLPEAIQNLMGIYPPDYFRLRKESFYSEHLDPYVKQGLKTALKNDVLLRVATKALSDFHVKVGDYPQGISFYQIYLSMDASKNSSNDYLDLGRLYLEQGQVDQSYSAFRTALEKSGNKSHDLKRIYLVFKKANMHELFLSFLTHVDGQAISQYDLEMAAVRCRMDMQDFEQAKEILTALVQTCEKDLVYYQLAVIAQKQKDWDGMELAAQKAIRLNPTKASYHYLFAKSLAKQKKYPQAEFAVTAAIQNATKENPWYHHFRASMRWAQKKYAPAISDWEKAFDLKPDKSDFVYRMALGYQHLGKFDKALTSIRKALALAPNNSTYHAFLGELDPEYLYHLP